MTSVLRTASMECNHMVIRVHKEVLLAAQKALGGCKMPPSEVVAYALLYLIEASKDESTFDKGAELSVPSTE